MPISQTDQLFQLIKSLSKSEKRNFTVYSSRIQDTENLKYVQLFELMDGQKTLDETQILSKLKDTDKSQYSNLKRHLYKQLMISLRLIYINKKAEIEIREHLDFADILYSKGLYLQSLKLINKAKGLAEATNNDLLRLSLLESEKVIESKHITRSGTNNTFKITYESLKLGENVINNTKLSNLGLLIHAFYIKNGHVKNAKEKEEINRFFEENMPSLDFNTFKFHEKVYFFQSLVWYYYILLDFENCMLHALKWVNLFNENPEMLEHEPDLYMRGYHYVLTSAFYIDDKEKFLKHHDILEKFRKENYKKFSHISQIVSFIYVHHSRMSKYMLLQRYEEGIKVIPNTLKRLSRYKDKLDPHRVMVFHYKIAWMYLMAKKPSEAIDYLNEILKMEVGTLREDIQLYTRLALLLAHYDLNNLAIMDYLVNNARSLAIKFSESNQMQMMTINFFAKITKIPVGDRKLEFRKFDQEMTKLRTNTFEFRAFIYLDICQWLQSKI
jgi:hypothetical protein